MTNQDLAIKYVAATLGLAAGILLLFSLTITSSPFKPVVTLDGAHLCFDGKLLAAGFGGPLVLTSDPCPGWGQAKPAALISAEHPNFMRCGLALLVISFVLQLLDIWLSAPGRRRSQISAPRLME